MKAAVSSRRRLWLILATSLLASLVRSPAVEAHPIAYSIAELRLTSQGIEAMLQTHVDSIRTLERQREILALMAERCVIESGDGPLEVQALRLEVSPDGATARSFLRYSMRGPATGITVRCFLFPEVPQHRTFVEIYERGSLVHQAVLDAGKPSTDFSPGSSQSRWRVFRDFVVQGIHHIFIGPDHILFVVGLLLIPAAVLQLLEIVTAFTLAHSVTLALATLGWVVPPARLIEPAIAASIVVVGIHALRHRGTGGDHRLAMAFAFGLLHGFGFANALREANLPRAALGWSLFGFNIGVEVGQACIVLVVAPALAVLRKKAPPALSRRVVQVGSILIIVAGTIWCIQRVTSN